MLAEKHRAGNTADASLRQWQWQFVCSDGERQRDERDGEKRQAQTASITTQTNETTKEQMQVPLAVPVLEATHRFSLARLKLGLSCQFERNILCGLHCEVLRSFGTSRPSRWQLQCCVP